MGCLKNMIRTGMDFYPGMNMWPHPKICEQTSNVMLCEWKEGEWIELYQKEEEGEWIELYQKEEEGEWIETTEWVGSVWIVDDDWRKSEFVSFF